MYPFCEFIGELLETGRVRVPSSEEIAPDDRLRVAERLREFEQVWRMDLAHQPPNWDEAVALAAAETVFHACRMLVYRELGPELVAQKLSPAIAADTSTASAHYSADVTLRFLPDLFRLARSAAAEDPLNEALLQLGNAWPLSSVGMLGIVPQQMTPILSDPSLLALYVDRVLHHADTSRLSEPQVRSAVLEAVGAFSDLAGSMRQALTESTESATQ